MTSIEQTQMKTHKPLSPDERRRQVSIIMIDDQIIKHLGHLKSDHTYLLLYVNSINFGEEGFKIGIPELYMPVENY